MPLPDVLVPKWERFIAVLAYASHIFLLRDDDGSADRPMAQPAAFSLPSLRYEVSMAVERHVVVVEVREAALPNPTEMFSRDMPARARNFSHRFAFVAL